MFRLADNGNGYWVVLLDDIIMFKGTECECLAYMSKFERN